MHGTKWKNKILDTLAFLHTFVRPKRKEMTEQSSPIYDKNTIEFVTVAAQVVAFLEKDIHTKEEFVDTSLKLFPLLYLKTLLLPACPRMDNRPPEAFVTEQEYNKVRMSIASCLGEEDDYLEVFLEDMAYSETPIKQSISEGIADLYQPLKDFLCVFQMAYEPTMNDALAECKALFIDFWGQRLVNVMRALHLILCQQRKAQADIEEQEESAYYGADFVTEEDLYEGLELGEEEDE